MSAIKITGTSFSGSGGVWGKGGLAAVLMGLAVDNAARVMQSAGIPAFIDNTGGNASQAGNVNHVPPFGRFNASAAGAQGVSQSALLASLAKLRNVEAVLVTDINAVRTLLGLVLISGMEGTVAAPHTLPALDKTATAGAQAAAVRYEAFIASAGAAKDNARKIFSAMNDVFTAAGQPLAMIGWTGSVPFGTAIEPVSDPIADTASAGANSVSLADATAFLAGMANNYALMAAAWNLVFNSTNGTVKNGRPLSVVAADYSMVRKIVGIQNGPMTEAGTSARMMALPGSHTIDPDNPTAEDAAGGAGTHGN